MSDELQIKEQFNKWAGWLKDAVFHVDNDYLKIDPSRGVKFQITTYMKRGYKYPFNISYSPQYNDLIMFSSKVGIEESDYQSLMALRKGERTQILMDMRKYVFPLGVSLEVKLPTFFLYKLIGLDSIRDDKNYFVGQIYNFRNAMELAKIRIDETFFRENPDGIKHDDDYYK